MFGWVKNANNLLTRGWVGGVLLSPVYKKGIQLFSWLVGKVIFIQLSIPLLLTRFSTTKFGNLYLLNSFYTRNPQGLLLEPLMRI